MLKEAIFHKADSDMCYMNDDGSVVIVLKAKKGDLSDVVMIYDDRYDTRVKREVVRVPLELVMSDELYDYFQADFYCRYSRMCYYFSLTDKAGNHTYMYQDGFSPAYCWGRQRLFQMPYLHAIDTAHVPAWLKETVMYQIFPDSFASGFQHLDGEPVTHTISSGINVESRYGGTIKGISANISYLKDLGINLLYLNPVFTANSYHKYDEVDYFNVDPCFGSNADLKELVNKCHQNGIRVMLDLVFNQSSSQFFAFRDVLTNGRNSIYADWYHIHDFPVRMGENPNYETFAFYDCMPKFNINNSQVEDYLLSVARFWVEECDVDGYRLDVANEMPHEFWRRFRYEMDKLKPDFALIGEVWHDAGSWIGRSQFHSVMNYPLMYAIWEFFGLNSMNAHQFGETINRLTMLYRWDNIMAMMNFIDTHDVGRFLTVADVNHQRQKMAAAFLMTYAGLPSIYYGDEKAMEGNDINDSRRKMIWQDNEVSGSMYEFYRQLIHIRKENPALTNGKYRPFIASVEDNLFGFLRFNDMDRIICLFNNSSAELNRMLALGNGSYIDLLTGEHFESTGDSNACYVYLNIKSFGVCILKAVK